MIFTLLLALFSIVMSLLLLAFISDFVSTDRRGSQAFAKIASWFLPTDIREATLEDWLATIELIAEESTVWECFLSSLGFLVAGGKMFKVPQILKRSRSLKVSKKEKYLFRNLKVRDSITSAIWEKNHKFLLSRQGKIMLQEMLKAYEEKVDSK